MRTTLRMVFALIVSSLIAASSAEAGPKIKIEFDKAYDFTKLKTYAWHPDGSGDIKLLEQAGDDPAMLLKRFDPVMRSAVEGELARKGLVPAAAGQPDLYLHYYVLIGPNSESQFRGQFVGGVPPWGLPDFEMTTTSLKIFEQGTIVLDLIDAPKREICWRGIAEAKVNRERTAAEREKRIREGIGDLLKKFPPKVTK